MHAQCPELRLRSKEDPNLSGQSPSQCKQSLLCEAKVPKVELEWNDTTVEAVRHDAYESFHLI